MTRFEILESLGVAVAAMSDRSDGDCRLSGPDGPLAHGNHARFCAACGVPPDDLVCAEQVHRATVVCAGEADRGRIGCGRKPRFEAADGLVTGVAGLPLAVFVADCVPLYLYDPQRRVGGLVHAGREGTRLNIAGAAVAALERELGSEPADLHAVVGPSAGPCCYEVSPEIARAFAAAHLPVRGAHLDLWQANVQQLGAAGVPRGHVWVAGICTICDGRYHSHRREPGGARNMALLEL